MRMFSQNINKIYSSLSSVAFDTLMWIVWGSFAAIFAATIISCFLSHKIKAASKRPYLCLVNAYAALTLASFLTANELPQSILAAVLFWCVGYVTYGALCMITPKQIEEKPVSQLALTAMPVQPQKAVAARTETSPAKSSVRLEHAITVTDKLLQKNLGKGDRQELEKLKNTLAVLQMRGTLSPSEADILNDNFNALLKLMAKYNM